MVRELVLIQIRANNTLLALWTVSVWSGKVKDIKIQKVIIILLIRPVHCASNDCQVKMYHKLNDSSILESPFVWFLSPSLMH